MAVVAIVTLRDSNNYITRKKVELEATTLAQAKTDMAAWATDFAAVSDLGIDVITYSERDTAELTSPGAGSLTDIGATFVGLVASGERVTVKVPGFKVALIGDNGQIDPAGTEVAAFLANYEAAGAMTCSDGETVSSWVGGSIDR